ERRLYLFDHLRIDRPGVAAAALDRVLPHSVDVEEKLLAMLRGNIEHCAIGRDLVLDRLAEMPFLRCDRKGQICFRQLARWNEWYLGRRWVADGLRQEPHHVMKVDC